MIESEELTPPIYEEEWAVIVGRETFTLTGAQMKILREADVVGKRSIIHFDNFGISIPHIQSYYLVSRRIKNQLEAPKESGEPITEEQRQANLEKLKKLREQYHFLKAS